MRERYDLEELIKEALEDEKQEKEQIGIARVTQEDIRRLVRQRRKKRGAKAEENPRAGES